MITREEVDAIADGPVIDNVKLQPDQKEKKANSREQTSSAINQVPRMNFASIGKDGKVKIEAVQDSKS